jgi:hypothetical protein
MKLLKAITYDGGRIVKMDNSSTCDETIPKWENRHFNEALEMLLDGEKDWSSEYFWVDLV